MAGSNGNGSNGNGDGSLLQRILGDGNSAGGQGQNQFYADDGQGNIGPVVCGDSGVPDGVDPEWALDDEYPRADAVQPSSEPQFSFQTDPRASGSPASGSSSGSTRRPSLETQVGTSHGGTRMRQAQAEPAQPAVTLDAKVEDMKQLLSQKSAMEGIAGVQGLPGMDYLDFRIEELATIQQLQSEIGLEQYTGWKRSVMEFLNRWGIYTAENRVRGAQRKMESLKYTLEKSLGKIKKDQDSFFKSSMENDKRLTTAATLKKVYEFELQEYRRQLAEYEGQKKQATIRSAANKTGLDKEATDLLEKIAALKSDIHTTEYKHRQIGFKIVEYDRAAQQIDRRSQRIQAANLLLEQAYLHTTSQLGELQQSVAHGMGNDGIIALLSTVQKTVNTNATMIGQLLTNEIDATKVFQKYGVTPVGVNEQRDDAYRQIAKSNAQQRDYVDQEANLIIERRGL